MKANVILGKKQIVIAALVLILGAAVYLNWQFADVPVAPTGGEVSGNTMEGTCLLYTSPGTPHFRPSAVSRSRCTNGFCCTSGWRG